MPTEVARHVPGLRAPRDEFVAQPRQQPFHHGQAARPDAVRVAALRNAFARRRIRGWMVALDQRDPFETIGQHARREQAGDAAADHDGMGAQAMVHRCLR